MDSLRTLSEENTALLRQIEDAKAARNEADEVKKKMKKFKEDYGKRFTSLKAALDKLRSEDLSKTVSCESRTPNIIETSNYLKERTRSEKERARQREKLIRKMDQVSLK